MKPNTDWMGRVWLIYGKFICQIHIANYLISELGTVIIFAQVFGMALL